MAKKDEICILGLDSGDSIIEMEGNSVIQAFYVAAHPSIFIVVG